MLMSIIFCYKFVRLKEFGCNLVLGVNKESEGKCMRCHI